MHIAYGGMERPTAYKILWNLSSWHQISFTKDLSTVQLTEFTWESTHSSTADSKPFSDDRGHFHIEFTRVWAVARQGKLRGTLPFQISANTAIHQSIFLRKLILKQIYSLSSYTWSSFCSSCLVPYGTYGGISTRTLVATVSSHTRIQAASFACSMARSTIKE